MNTSNERKGRKATHGEPRNTSHILIPSAGNRANFENSVWGEGEIALVNDKTMINNDGQKPQPYSRSKTEPTRKSHTAGQPLTGRRVVGHAMNASNYVEQQVREQDTNERFKMVWNCALYNTSLMISNVFPPFRNQKLRFSISIAHPPNSASKE